jgi:hypothetical protein
MLTVWLTARHFNLAIMSLHAITIIRLSPLAPTPPQKKIVAKLKLELISGTVKFLINKCFLQTHKNHNE